MVARVHDIYSNRILSVLASMQEVTLQILPGDDEIWTLEEFLERSEESCRQAAIELNRKSQMVEEAVEEVLGLVDKASQIFQKMIGVENDLFADLSKGKSLKLICTICMKPHLNLAKLKLILPSYKF